MNNRSLKTTEFQDEILGIKINLSEREILRKNQRSLSTKKRKDVGRRVTMDQDSSKDELLKQFRMKANIEHLLNNNYVYKVSKIEMPDPTEKSPNVLADETLKGSKVSLHNKAYSDYMRSMAALEHPKPSSYAAVAGGWMGQGQPCPFVKYPRPSLNVRNGSNGDADNSRSLADNLKRHSKSNNVKDYHIHTSNGDVVSVTKKVCEKEDMSVIVTSHRPYRIRRQNQQQELARMDLPVIDYEPRFHHDGALSKEEHLKMPTKILDSRVDLHPDVGVCKSHANDDHLDVGVCKSHANDDHFDVGICKNHANDDHFDVGICKSHANDDHLDVGICKSHANDDHLDVGVCKSHANDDYFDVGICKSHANDDHFDVGICKSHANDDHFDVGVCKSHANDDHFDVGVCKSHADDDHFDVGVCKSHANDDHLDVGAGRGHVNDYSIVGREEVGEGYLQKYSKPGNTQLDAILSQEKSEEEDISKMMTDISNNDSGTLTTKTGQEEVRPRLEHDIIIPSDHKFGNGKMLMANDILSFERSEKSFLSSQSFEEAKADVILEGTCSQGNDNDKEHSVNDSYASPFIDIVMDGSTSSSERRECVQSTSNDGTTQFQMTQRQHLEIEENEQLLHAHEQSNTILHPCDLSLQESTGRQMYQHQDLVESTIADINVHAIKSSTVSGREKAPSLRDRVSQSSLVSDTSLSQMNSTGQSNFFFYSHCDDAHIHGSRESRRLNGLIENAKSPLENVTFENESNGNRGVENEIAMKGDPASSNGIRLNLSKPSETNENTYNETSLHVFYAGRDESTKDENLKRQYQAKQGNLASQATSMMSFSDLSLDEEENTTKVSATISVERGDTLCLSAPQHCQGSSSYGFSLSSGRDNGDQSSMIHNESLHKSNDDQNRSEGINTVGGTLSHLIDVINMKFCDNEIKTKQIIDAMKKENPPPASYSAKTACNAHSHLATPTVENTFARTFDKDSEPFKTRAERFQIKEKVAVRQYNEPIQTPEILGASSLSFEDKVIYNSSYMRTKSSSSEKDGSGLIKAGCYIWLPQTDQLPTDLQEGCSMFEAVKLPGLAKEKAMSNLLMKNQLTSPRQGPQVPSRYLKVPQHKISMMEENKAKIRARRNDSWQNYATDESKNTDDIHNVTEVSSLESYLTCNPLTTLSPKGKDRLSGNLFSFEDDSVKTQRDAIGRCQTSQGKGHVWGCFSDKVSRPRAPSIISLSPALKCSSEVHAPRWPKEEKGVNVGSLLKPSRSKERLCNKLIHQNQTRDINKSIVDSLLNIETKRTRLDMNTKTESSLSARGFYQKAAMTRSLSSRNWPQPYSFSTGRAGREVTIPRKQMDEVCSESINRRATDGFSISKSSGSSRNINLANRNHKVAGTFSTVSNDCQMPSLVKLSADGDTPFVNNTLGHELPDMTEMSELKLDYGSHNSSFQEKSNSMRAVSRCSNNALSDSAKPKMDTMTSFSVMSLPETFVLPTKSYISTVDGITAASPGDPFEDSMDPVNSCDNTPPVKCMSVDSVRMTLNPCVSSENLGPMNDEANTEALNNKITESIKTSYLSRPDTITACNSPEPKSSNIEESHDAIKDTRSKSINVSSPVTINVDRDPDLNRRVIGDYLHHQSIRAPKNVNDVHISKQVAETPPTCENVTVPKSPLFMSMGDSQVTTTSVSKSDGDNCPVTSNNLARDIAGDGEVSRLKSIPELSSFDVLVTGSGLVQTSQVTKTAALPVNSLQLHNKYKHTFQDQSRLWKMIGNQHAVTNAYVSSYLPKRAPKKKANTSPTGNGSVEPGTSDGGMVLTGQNVFTGSLAEPKGKGADTTAASVHQTNFLNDICEWQCQTNWTSPFALCRSCLEASID